MRRIPDFLKRAYDAATGSLKIKGDVNTQLTGSDMELWGATTATRPDANTVDVGTVFIAIDNGQYNATVSDGTDWEDA